MGGPPYLHCIYADDIRQEVGGKYSIIGVYQTGMNVQGVLPASVPRLGIVMEFVAPLSLHYASAEFVVTLNDDEIGRVDVPRDLIAQMHREAGQDKDATLTRLVAVAGIQPLNIAGPGTIRVTATVDGERVAGNQLVIRVQPSPDPVQ